MNTFIYLTLAIGVFDLIATVSAKFWSLKQNLAYRLFRAFLWLKKADC